MTASNSQQKSASGSEPQSPQGGSEGSSPATRRKRKIAMVILGGIFILIAILWLIYYLIWGQFEVYTDDAYVNGNIVQIMPQVTGTVIEIDTDDTHLVMQGQTIIKLDPSDATIALERAKANLALTVRQVRQYFENAQQVQSTVILRNADLLKAQLDYKRRVGLVGERAISREELQHYKTSLEGAQAQYNSAVHTLGSSVALIENSYIYTHPLVERAKANLRNAYLSLQRTTIVAPVTGIVGKRTVQVGQQVALNTPMLAIIPLNQMWVDANYKESQLNYLRVGQPVQLTADAYPDFTYHAKVAGLNVGTGAAYAILPPQNATGNWIKIVQRLPVRIVFDPKELQDNPLQLGLSVRVTADIHNLKGSRLAAEPRKEPVYVTDVYAKQLAQANELIDTILKQNSPNLYMPFNKGTQ